MFLSSSILSHYRGESYHKLRSKIKFFIKDVFINYWDAFVEQFPEFEIRDVVFKEVDKICKCRTTKLGYTMFECSHCNNFIIVPHTCKSRFCSSCGVKYIKARVLNAKNKFMNVKHRHIVFTIPDNLRTIFLEDRSLLNELFNAVSQTFAWIFNPSSYQNKQKKKPINKRNKKITRVNSDSCKVPGYVSVIHTYGRDLKWNPHIHVLITEAALTNKCFHYKKYGHYNYEQLRKTFQKILLDNLYKKLGRPFYKTKCLLYSKHNNGFYVNAPDKKHKTIEGAIEYILRYAGKPAMAESRITNINYDNDTISYWYDDHKTGKRINVTEHVYTFIAKLIRHIPDENFKNIRYYGLYAAKNHKYRNNYYLLYNQAKILKEKLNASWRYYLMVSFNYDPLLCECGHKLIKTTTYIPINEQEDQWYEIKHSKQKWQPLNWESFTNYCPEG